MDTNGFIVCIKTEDSYVDTTKDVETRFNNSNYELETPLPKAKKIELIKYKLGKKITKLTVLRPKVCSR